MVLSLLSRYIKRTDLIVIVFLKLYIAPVNYYWRFSENHTESKKVSELALCGFKSFCLQWWSSAIWPFKWYPEVSTLGENINNVRSQTLSERFMNLSDKILDDGSSVVYRIMKRNIEGYDVSVKVMGLNFCNRLFSLQHMDIGVNLV